VRLLAPAAVLIGLLSIGAAPSARVQPPPPTEVYLASLASASAETASVSGVVNISNDPEYDNQPSFTPDGRAVLFTSRRDGKQTDIYRYDVASRALTQLTHTAESEYSPIVTPDGRTFSVIRVEADGAQRLWRFDMDGTHPRLVLDQIKPVGYHAWIDATHLALFVLGASGQPATLQIADTATGRAETVATNIGRSLAVRPHSSPPIVTYVSKAARPWVISSIDPVRHTGGEIATLPTNAEGPASEDYAWNPASADGQLLMATGATLMAFQQDARGGPPWRPIADLSTSGVVNITRLAVSPDGKWLAFVAQPAPGGVAPGR
jgi:dipeptidyl aminopeptidase/acylaminoacyl peptidase